MVEEDLQLEGFRTVAEVRRELFNKDNIRNGQTCPCCLRFMKMYQWTFLQSMVIALGYFYKHYKEKGNVFVHFENYLRDNKATECRGAFNYLKYWGMIEKPDPEDPKEKGKVRGYYRITDKGILFLKGGISVPKNMFLYDDEVKEWSTELVFVYNVIKNFDYETMVLGQKELLDDDEIIPSN